MNRVCEPASVTLPPMPGRGISTRTQIVAASCACACATAFLYAVDPMRHAVYPQCLLYRATGIYCAGCGATRAIYALLHGRVLEALHDNVLFIAVLPVLIYFAVSHAAAAWRRNAWPEIPVDGRRFLKRGIWVFLVMLAFMILRNLPGWPFELLKPVG